MCVAVILCGHASIYTFVISSTTFTKPCTVSLFLSVPQGLLMRSGFPSLVGVIRYSFVALSVSS